MHDCTARYEGQPQRQRCCRSCDENRTSSHYVFPTSPRSTAADNPTSSAARTEDRNIIAVVLNRADSAPQAGPFCFVQRGALFRRRLNRGEGCILATTAMIATEMPAAIRPYSIAARRFRPSQIARNPLHGILPTTYDRRSQFYLRSLHRRLQFSIGL
jgi:hypothetical protein